MSHTVVITYDNESLARIYGPKHVFLHPTDGRIQLSPTPEPITDYWTALRTFNLASDWMDEQIIHGAMGNSTVTFTGPDGMFRSHSYSTGNRAPLTLAKPAHPNLLTNV